jgi:protein-S-isoprenylcysteine O-methyltransferase Ste14
LIQSLGLKIQFLPEGMAKPLFTSHWAQIAGGVMICVCIFVFILALVSFKTSWRIGIDTVAPGGLITTGIFSVSRNPVFLSMDLYFLGTFLIYSNIFFLLCAIAIAMGFHFQIRQEERFLLRQYGGTYSGYMTQVGRYL